MRLISRTLLFSLVSLAILLASEVSAKQYEIQPSGRGSVAHTRLAPVVVHRAFPPFKGQHVYRPRAESKYGPDSKLGAESKTIPTP